jgi:hypothetical protein
MVDTPLPCLVINVKVLEIVVEVHTAGAEVSPEEGGMGGEDGGDVDVSFAAEGDGEPGLPFVEVSDDSGRGVMTDELEKQGKDGRISYKFAYSRSKSRPSLYEPLPRTKRQDIQTRSSRSSRDRLVERGSQRWTRGRPSTRPTYEVRSKAELESASALVSRADQIASDTAGTDLL